MKKTTILNVLVLSALSLLLAGCYDEYCDSFDPECNCNDVRGGGWYGSDGKAKVNLGFQLTCEVTDDGMRLVGGQLQVNDVSENIRFHGIALETPLNPQIELFEGKYVGDYTPQPKKAGDGGRFEVHFTNLGDKGPTDDLLTLKLTGGVYDGYEISGELGGGNIVTK